MLAKRSGSTGSVSWYTSINAYHSANPCLRVTWYSTPETDSSVSGMPPPSILATVHSHKCSKFCRSCAKLIAKPPNGRSVSAEIGAVRVLYDLFNHVRRRQVVLFDRGLRNKLVMFAHHSVPQIKESVRGWRNPGKRLLAPFAVGPKSSAENAYKRLDCLFIGRALRAEVVIKRLREPLFALLHYEDTNEYWRWAGLAHGVTMVQCRYPGGSAN
jgi:hypothetical protein